MRRRAAWHPDFSDLAVRNDDARFVANLDLTAAWSTDRTSMSQPIAPADLADDLALGAAVHLIDPFRPEPVDPALLEPDRAGLSDVPDEAK